MIGRQVKRSIAAFILLIAVTGSQAASLALLPFTPTVKVGEVIAVGVFSNFSDDPIIGGTFDTLFDSSKVTFNQYIPAPSQGPFPPAFARIPDLFPIPSTDFSVLWKAAFGNTGGMTGPDFVALMLFTANSPGIAPFLLLNPTFVSVTGAPVIPNRLHAFVQIVPVPASVWLFGTGLIGLAGIVRKQRSTQVRKINRRSSSHV